MKSPSLRFLAGVFPLLALSAVTVAEDEGPALGVRLPGAKRAGAKPEVDRDKRRLVLIELGFGKAESPELEALCAEGGPIPAERVGDVGERASMVTAPRLTVFDGQPARVSIVESKSYVHDRDAAGEPVEAEIRVGSVFDVRTEIAPDEKSVKLHLRVRTARLREPVREVATGRGRVGMPRITKRETALSLFVPDGGTVHVGLPRALGGSAALLVVRARVVKSAPPAEKAERPVDDTGGG